MTTSDFNRGIVKDKTRGTNAPFIDLYKDEIDINTGKPLVAPATVFVSHAWKYPFVEVVVDVMEQYNEENPNTYFWFDLFTNDQNANDKKDADWYSTTFRESIKRIGTVVLILSPWQDPKPIKRAWCLFEIAHALRESNVKMSIKFPNSERDSMKTSAAENGHVITEALADIKAEDADATVERDKEMIFESIRNFEGGFQALDEKVKDKLRHWYTSQLVKLSEENPNDNKLLLTVADVLKDFNQVKIALEHGERLLNNIGRKMPAEKDAKEKDKEGKDPKSKLWEDTMLTLGILNERSGNTDEAIKIYNELLAYLKRTRDDDDIEIAKIYNNTAGIHRNRGNLQEALKSHKEALKIKIKSRGEDAVTVGISHLNMGNVYLDEMDLNKAMTSYEKAMQIFIAQHRDNHPRVGKCLANMGEVYLKLNKFQRCLDVQSEALRIKRTTIGKIHVEVANTYNCMGQAYRELGNFSKAIECHKQALGIFTDSSPNDHIEFAKTHRFIGEVYSRQGEYYKAHDEYRESLQKNVQASGDKPQTREVSLLYVSLGDTHFAQKDLALAQKNYEMALEIQKLRLGMDHPQLGMTYDKLAEVKLKIKKLDDALQHANEALKIKQRRLHEHHPSVIISHKQIADIYQAQGHMKEATKILGIKEKLEQIQTEENDLEMALKHLKSANQSKAKRLGEQHPDVLSGKETIKDVHKSLGWVDEEGQRQQQTVQRSESNSSTMSAKTCNVM